MIWQPAPTDTERWVIATDELEIIADVERVDLLYRDVKWHARVWERGSGGGRRLVLFGAFSALDEAKRSCEEMLMLRIDHVRP